MCGYFDSSRVLVLTPQVARPIQSSESCVAQGHVVILPSVATFNIACHETQGTLKTMAESFTVFDMFCCVLALFTWTELGMGGCDEPCFGPPRFGCPFTSPCWLSAFWISVIPLPINTQGVP